MAGVEDTDQTDGKERELQRHGLVELFGGVVAGGIDPAQEGTDGQQTHGGAREGTSDDQAVGSAEAVRGQQGAGIVESDAGARTARGHRDHQEDQQPPRSLARPQQGRRPSEHIAPDDSERQVAATQRVARGQPPQQW